VNGGWNFWVAFAWWLIWFAIYTFYMIRYARRQMVESATEPLQAPVEVTAEDALLVDA
jgi:hypothetical protein